MALVEAARKVRAITAPNRAHMGADGQPVRFA
jgi:hypothetical protein